MNFIEEFKKGQNGSNRGLPFGQGLEELTKVLNGIQKGRYFCVSAEAKVGKSTLANYAFILSPYLYALDRDINIEWIYLSLEMTRIDLEFVFIVAFMHLDYVNEYEEHLRYVKLDDGQTINGENCIELSPEYLRGRLVDDKDKVIKVKDSILEMLKETYNKRIIPLFGEYDSQGRRITKGKMTVIETSDNPTGIRNSIRAYAAQHGEFVKTQAVTDAGVTIERVVGYKPNDPDKYTILVLDHARKLVRERGFNMKDNMDKMSEYFVEERNLLNWTIVSIVHLNRSASELDRLKAFGDLIFPTSSSIKDSGNVVEDADYVLTMFNPNDSKYNLKKHFGATIKDVNGNEIYPEYRSLHLVESRHTIFPVHFRLSMFGALKVFKKSKVVTDKE